jgi:hypothetical protein
VQSLLSAAVLNRRVKLWIMKYGLSPGVWQPGSDLQKYVPVCSGVPRNFVCGGSTNSVEDRGQRERGSGGGNPLVRGSAQFAIRFDFVKLWGCRRLLRMYFPWNWEFGSALSKLRNFGGRGV